MLHKYLISVALLAAAPSPAGAQIATEAARTGQQQAATPLYRSALDGYRRFAEEPVASWRDANDRVGAIGGWRAYAREAQATSSDAPSGTAPRSQGPAPASASGHDQHHQ